MIQLQSKSFDMNLSAGGYSCGTYTVTTPSTYVTYDGGGSGGTSVTTADGVNDPIVVTPTASDGPNTSAPYETITLTISLTSYPTVTTTFTFYVKIEDKCVASVLSLPTPSSVNFSGVSVPNVVIVNNVAETIPLTFVSTVAGVATDCGLY